MKLCIVTAALLGAVLSPALAEKNGEKPLNGQQGGNSHHPATRGSSDFKTLWDTKTGYVATKVLSKNTCVISSMGRAFWFNEPHRGPKGSRPRYSPPRQNRFVISTKALQSLEPYGKRIQALCRGVPSYFAYPSPGFNFLEQAVSCFTIKVNGWPVRYCD
ncbi:gastrokine-1-like [Melanerpes formicivorus]|uniref:gastrokine-1-like n=1 Tax=Melanerpes formicivorus TaxID=211600 RepID=UPI00358FCC6F